MIEDKLMNRWLKTIPSYLAYVNNDYKAESDCRTNRQKGKHGRQKVHLLMVEGTFDKKVYEKTFDYPSDPTNPKSTINFDVSKKMYVPNDYCVFMKDYYQVNEDNKMRNVKFVQALEDYFENNKDLYPYIEYYSFIDRDYDNECNGLTQLGITQEHDIETNLIVNYMDLYFNDLEYKEEAFNVFWECFKFCLLQGLLGFTCKKYTETLDDDALIKKYIDYYHSYFKNTKYQSYIEKNFNIIEYADDLPPSKEFLELLENVLKCNNFNKVSEDLRNFLLTKSPYNSNKIKHAFTFINGHMFLEQLVINGAKYFNLNYGYKGMDLNKCTSIIVNNLIKYIKVAPERMYNTAPLDLYKEWRFDNYYLYTKKKK